MTVTNKIQYSLYPMIIGNDTMLADFICYTSYNDVIAVSILPLEIDISKLSYKCRFTYITYSYYKMFTTKNDIAFVFARS